MTKNKRLSQELGTPLKNTDYTLGEITAKIQDDPKAVSDALIWTREYWKNYLPKYDDKATTVGYDPNIWYDEAIRKLFHASVEIDNETGICEELNTFGVDAEWAGLIATAIEFYEEYYHHLRKGPE